MQQAALTHRLLAEWLPLDPLGDLLQEVNEAVTLPYGRIALHVFAELTTDVMTNWAFNTTTRRYA